MPKRAIICIFKQRKISYIKPVLFSYFRSDKPATSVKPNKLNILLLEVKCRLVQKGSQTFALICTLDMLYVDSISYALLVHATSLTRCSR